MSITKEYLDELKGRIEEEREEFLKDLVDEEDWVACKGNDHANLFYKNDPKSSIKKFKICAVMPCRMATVISALLDPENRVSWEVLVDSMKTIETFEDGYSMHYITTKSLAAGLVGRRDFVHFRKIYDNVEKKENELDAKMIIDISCEHPDYADQKGFVRGTTLFCATIFREYLENGVYETTYESVTQTDINGMIPSFFINTASKSSTLEWYQKLEGKALALESELPLEAQRTI
ncbi:steroidogenic acute regulatory, putative [Entamoeba invadens IP1]|uniref:Steroidogenic acute regulatory, putative n=1 Tax=Entamoeba invadens IP1 TaxID=370355 RepID=A0A0A1U4X9_ENTIV|nr:steroidogenic acute regulatory, putative [Entamoeba invadens IP1]ELP89234.1 steroidogenic acute regulatory, putative [Entamoeba invadens IP1]|eukprot:XP_004256005.1 steroidogenic acute regulatory, putative [Entamoeba invadens IP1]